jgi:hypothetical protein
LSEFLLLEHTVVEPTVAKHMIRQAKPPSQNWQTFLANHVGQIVAIDFFTVPTAQWAAQQIVEASWEKSPGVGAWTLRQAMAKCV